MISLKKIIMILSEIKNHLENLTEIAFQLPNGELVPRHFHVTEVGKITKDFIDCGGVLRKEEVISFQLWEADDYDHRLHPQKLLGIIELSEKVLNLKDADIEVEYQDATIGKYGLGFDGTNFLLTNTKTDCLAKDKCGVPEPQQQGTNACTPGSGCC